MLYYDTNSPRSFQRWGAGHSGLRPNTAARKHGIIAVKKYKVIFDKERQTMKMPKGNIDVMMFAPCGMNCMVCRHHCYRKKSCAGCLQSDMGKPEHCRTCKIKNCIEHQGGTYCFECSDYPCKLIKNLEKSYRKRYQASLMENSEAVRQHGLELFMKLQKEKYTCPKCRGIISIHDRECSECQGKMKYE